MNKKLKKGFTIVELVIVIAVIAILSAVLIPTFGGLIKKANIAADGALVRELNNAISIDASENGKHETMAAALAATDEYGFNVQRINAKAGKNEILWDSVNDVFCYFDDETGDITYIPEAPKAKEVKPYQYFVIKDIASSADLSDIYSTYIRKCTATSLETSKGLDVGDVTTLSTITYTNNGESQEVVIRTNGGTLVINAENDTVRHYGVANVVDIQKVADTSYYENGVSTFVKVAQGRVVVGDSEEVEVGGIHVTANTAIVAVENNAELPAVTFDSSVTQFLVQTTNSSGVKTTESIVAIAANVDVSDDNIPVPQEIQVKLETAIASEKQKTIDEASEQAANEVLPVGVARIGAIGYVTIDEAVNALQSGQTLVLLADIERNTVLTFSSGIKTLDLNGYTITANLRGGSAIQVSGSSTLNIYDNSENKTGKVVGERVAYGVSGILVTGAESVLNVYGGTIIGYTQGIDIQNKGNINLIDGIVKSSQNSSPAINFSTNTGGILSMTGGELIANNYYAINVQNGASTTEHATINISGGIVSVQNNNKAAFKVASFAEYNLSSNVAVNAKYIFECNLQSYSTIIANLTINGGTYSITDGGAFVLDQYSSKAKTTLTITAGTFNFEPSVQGFKSGSTIGTVNNNGDGTWTVTAVA